MSSDQLYMVFDVESIGLHGEGWAVGWVVVDAAGAELDYGRLAVDPNVAQGEHEGRVWVADNCPTILPTHQTTRGIRTSFWGWWQAWKRKGAVLVAECAWPVEARFLIACVDDGPQRGETEQRIWNGPYPLHELASVMVAAGMDPMATYDRLPDEPQHDPLGDARQSARLLLMALERLRHTEAGS
jgi:hypothetical protein